MRDGHYLCLPVPLDNSQLHPTQMQDQSDAGNAKIAVEEGKNEKAKSVTALRQEIKERHRQLFDERQPSQ